MRHVPLAIALLGTALVVSAPAAATPGNGTNAVYIFNDYDSGVGEITLVSQASALGVFVTAHAQVSNRPAPLISLSFEVVLDGIGVVDSGTYSHAHSQRGQPIVACSLTSPSPAA